MSVTEQAITPINFSEQMSKELPPFVYAENPLYNISTPVFALILSLSRLPKPDNLAQFRADIKQKIIELSETGEKLEFPKAVIDKLCCLHCIVIDEFIVHSQWGVDAGWENKTLLSELFGLRNGGELFFTVTDKALRQASKMTELLEVAYVLLQMGFKGQYRSRQSENLAFIIKDIGEAISQNIQPADILLHDIPRVKARSLLTGVRFLSFSLVLLILLAVLVTFVDYWYKESSSLRSQPFDNLHQATHDYILNTDEKEIVYISTEEDIHSISMAAPRVSTAIITPEPTKKVETVLPEVQQMTTPRYRVQLASFSVQNNAKTFLSRLSNSQYPVLEGQWGRYFTLYTQAHSDIESLKQKQYFHQYYGLDVVIIDLEENKP